MTRIRALLIGAMAVVGLFGCGTDESVSPTPDYAAAWAGEYEGSANYLLANGSRGSSNKATLSIKAVDPKRISVLAKVNYVPVGSTRAEDAVASALVIASDPERLQVESRSGIRRTVFLLIKTETGMAANIATSRRQVGGDWFLEQQLEMELRRK